MAIAINGTGTITGISVGGLNDSIITSAELANGAVTAAKIDSLPAGSILQVVSATKTNTQSFTSSTPADISGLSVSITPSSTDSKILVFGYVNGAWQSGIAKLAINLLRGSTAILRGDVDGVKARVSGGIYLATENYAAFPMPFNYLDSPASTSALTYKIQGINLDNAGTVYVNRGYTSDNYNYNPVTASTITAMEVAG